MAPFVRTLVEASVGLVIIALAWAIASVVIDNAAKLPPLMAVLRKTVELAGSDDYLRHVSESSTALFLGLLPALVVGVLLGACAGLSPSLRWLLGPLAITLGGAPLIALVPIFLAWFGLTMLTKALTVFVVAAFPVMIMVMVATGAKGGASPVCTILAGLRLGLVLGVSALVVVEFVASSRGVGYFITNSANMFDTTAMVAGIVLVAVPTTLVAALLQAIEEQVAG